MTVADIIAQIERVAPPDMAAEWDNVGLQVGDRAEHVETVLVTLDVTPAVVDEATAVGAGLIVAHHPLIFEPLRALVADDPVAALAGRLLGLGISLYVAHTNLDAAPEIGTSAALFDALGLHNPRPLPEEGELCAGAVGDLPEPLTAAGLAEHVARSLGAHGVRVVGPRGRPVRVVAVMPGSGGDAVRPAAHAGAEALVCGDLKHHDALDALALGLVVLDAGHYATELPVVGRLARYLRESCGGAVAVKQSRVVTDPFADVDQSH